jgi:hypothetical protein
MKKILLSVSIVVARLGAAMFVYHDKIAMLLAFNKLKPARPFGAASTPASPDYSRRETWAALLDREDSADALAAIGVMDQRSALANRD